MSASSWTILCRYQYDPLDRLVGVTPGGRPGTQRFYQEEELINEIEGETQLTVIRHEAQPLAQRLRTAGTKETTLLATDQQRSPLAALMDTTPQQLTYTAYGYRRRESGLSSLLGFNGERPESVTGHYLLGQGNRAFNPVLMRFNSPDELSPFGNGGINPYAYCGGDPVNRYDPSGNIPLPFAPWNLPRNYPIIFPKTIPQIIDRPSAITRPTVSRSSQTTTFNKPFDPRKKLMQNYIAKTESASASDRASTLLVLPPEGPPQSYRRQIDLLPPKQAARIIEARELTADARLYDRLMKTKPDSRMMPKTTLLTNFYNADARLETLKAGGSTLKQRSDARSSLQWARKQAKRSALINAGIRTE